MFSRFRSRPKTYSRTILLQQLEDRIVLDAAVPDQQPQSDSPDHSSVIDNANPLVDAGTAQTTGQVPQANNPSRQDADSEPLNVILVSNAVADVATISQAAEHDAQVIIFDSTHDNLSSAVGMLDDLKLSTGHRMGTVAVFDHGGAGYFNVGSDQVNLHNLWAYESLFERLRADLASNAQIQLYACDTAGNDLGSDLMNSIALYTGANVFASADDTGGLYGNWALEYSSGTGAQFHSIVDSGCLKSYQSDLGLSATEPNYTWFHGTGTFAGWDIYNYDAGVYYTKDYSIFWQHLDAGAWNFYDGSVWEATNTLGQAHYDGDYGPFKTWFHEDVGPYAGHDVYIDAKVTYYSDDYDAPAATYWSRTDAGAWSYYDASSWKPAPGFDQEPVNAWFHGFGSDLGWDTYNYSEGSYYTKDYSVFWHHVNAGDTWNFYNGYIWVSTTTLGEPAYDFGTGPWQVWFQETDDGTAQNWDVYMTNGVTYYSRDFDAPGATYWRHNASAWSYYDTSKWVPCPGFDQEPVNAWFHGFGSDLGWDTYNYDAGVYYTKDYNIFWQHLDAGAWNFYDGSVWEATNTIGQAHYDGDYGPFRTWFHEDVGPYAGHDVYIDAKVTYYSDDWDASGATYWSRTDAGAWSYYDASSWKPAPGFDQEPVNAWFHGFGSDLGWDTYNYSEGSYYTKDYSVFWHHVNAGDTWKFYNGYIWVSTTTLGEPAYDFGTGPWQVWFQETDDGTAQNWDVYMTNGVTYYSRDFDAPGATYWRHNASAWSYYDTSKWVPCPGFDQEPVNAWFHGYGGDSGYDVYNGAGVQYYTTNYVVYWQHADSGNAWKYYDGSAWLDAGIVRVTDPGEASAYEYLNGPYYLCVYDGDIYFSYLDGLYNPDHGRELWRYDPATGTTAIAVDLFLGPTSSSPYYMTVFDGKLFFSASEYYDTGHEMWYFDASQNKVSFVADFWPGGDSSYPSCLTPYGEKLYFFTRYGTATKFWELDPTDRTVHNIGIVGQWDDGFSEITILNGDLYWQTGTNFLTHPEGQDNVIMHRYDPDTGTMDTVTSCHTPGLLALNGKLYFNGSAGISTYDPNTGSISQVSSLSGREFTALSGDLYFSTYLTIVRYDPDTGQESTVISRPEEFPCYNLIAFDGDLYFNSDIKTVVPETGWTREDGIYRYDPVTNTVTILTPDLYTDLGSTGDNEPLSGGSKPVVLGGALYFTADGQLGNRIPGSSWCELYRYIPLPTIAGV